ncbi:hypothetical protein Acr_07g0014650 [Actinidia rufa]|uniref:Uncharacterized protein n=1 Tax=Actinidia rufa TaxID=165716 RepID=A0A7J0EZ80_9ERIC|nr:hypothetical protein Acr_07g0014650 [Actinidia rufa]
MVLPVSPPKTDAKPTNVSSCEFRSLPTCSIFMALNSFEAYSNITPSELFKTIPAPAPTPKLFFAPSMNIFHAEGGSWVTSGPPGASWFSKCPIVEPSSLLCAETRQPCLDPQRGDFVLFLDQLHFFIAAFVETVARSALVKIRLPGSATATLNFLAGEWTKRTSGRSSSSFAIRSASSSSPQSNLDFCLSLAFSAQNISTFSCVSWGPPHGFGFFEVRLVLNSGEEIVYRFFEDRVGPLPCQRFKINRIFLPLFELSLTLGGRPRNFFSLPNVVLLDSRHEILKVGWRIERQVFLEPSGSPSQFRLALSASRRSTPDLVHSGDLLCLLVATVLLSVWLSTFTCVFTLFFIPTFPNGECRFSDPAFSSPRYDGFSWPHQPSINLNLARGSTPTVSVSRWLTQPCLYSVADSLPPTVIVSIWTWGLLEGTLPCKSPSVPCPPFGLSSVVAPRPIFQRSYYSELTKQRRLRGRDLCPSKASVECHPHRSPAQGTTELVL